MWTAVASQPRRGTPSICKSRRRDWKRLALRSSERSAIGSLSTLLLADDCGILDLACLVGLLLVWKGLKDSDDDDGDDGDDDDARMLFFVGGTPIPTF